MASSHFSFVLGSRWRVTARSGTYISNPLRDGDSFVGDDAVTVRVGGVVNDDEADGSGIVVVVTGRDVGMRGFIRQR